MKCFCCLILLVAHAFTKRIITKFEEMLEAIHGSKKGCFLGQNGAGRGKKRSCFILIDWLSLLCTYHRHPVTETLPYRPWLSSVLMLACPLHRHVCLIPGPCRHFVIRQSVLLNSKSEFCTEMQSSDCALHFDLSMVLSLVTLSFNVDIHLGTRLDLPGKHFEGCVLNSGLLPV